MFNKFMGSYITKPKEQEKNEELEAIRRVVKQMLADKDINTLIPDVIESKIYENLLVVLFGHLKNTLSTTKVQFMEHEITLTIKPLESVV